MECDGFDVDGSCRAPASSGGRRGAVFATLMLAGLALAFAAVDAAFAGEAEGATEAVATAEPAPGPIDDSPAPVQRWSTVSEFSGGNYRWSLSRGGLDLGLGFDTPARIRSAPVSPLDASGPFVQTLPTVSLGLRSVEVAPGGNWLRQLAGSDAASGLTHRIGIEWKPVESQVMFIRDGLGMRLTGDDRLTMRLRKGTLGIYMKRQF